jgi:hypothetical protein
MAFNNYDEMKRRLEELERENARLKGEKIIKPEDIQTITGVFQGHPVLKFEGPFRPFTLGLRKSWIVIQKIDDIRRFVELNKHQLPHSSDGE